MTATTTDRDGTRKTGEIIAYPMAASAKVYKEAMSSIDASGNLVDLTDPSGNFAGVNFEGIDNSSGSAGDVYCQVREFFILEYIFNTFLQLWY